MCGIAGFTTFQRPVEDPENLIRNMIGPIIHRGPDAYGSFTDRHVVLGHSRLSIIDLDHGDQPMSIEDGRYQIIYNGEIYNYIELRKDLEARGRHFFSRSDTEVILHQYAEDGVDAVKKFNGMFAFAIWDSERRELFLARDRMGEKPLFYSLWQGEFVFASELKSLLQYPGIQTDIDFLSISKYLTFGFVPAPHTIYKDIFKLEPGCWILFNFRRIRKSTYWDIPLQDHPVNAFTMEQSEEHIRSLLRSSVRQRLRSDVPLGIFLSGGIDSSAITAFAAQESPSRLSTFSIGFEETTYDESRYAKKVAALFDTEHYHEVLSMRRASEILPEIAALADEPFADPSIIPTYQLSQLARKQVKVVLSGDGSDELFIGYPSFIAHKITEALSFLRISWRDALNRMARKIPVSSNYASIDFLLQQYFKGAGISSDARFLIWMGFCGNEERNQILNQETREALLYDDPFEDVLNYVRKSGLTDAFQRITYLCMKMYLQDLILVKMDRASMSHSLEVRLPFLDHHMVEFACSIHPKYKLNGITTKYILKKAMKDVLPAEIIHRRKAGFMMPIAKWLTEQMRPLLEEVCSPRQIEQDGIFHAPTMSKLIDEHVRHVRDHRKVLWAVLCFQLWKKSLAHRVKCNV